MAIYYAVIENQYKDQKIIHIGKHLHNHGNQGLVPSTDQKSAGFNSLDTV